MKKTLLCLSCVLFLLVPAAMALAASMPKPTDSTIKVPTTIAGIKIGMAEAKAKAAWGSGRGKCESSATTGNAICIYGSEHTTGGFARIDFLAGKVGHVQIFTGETTSGDQLASAGGALLKIKTKEGIGLGSKFSELKKAYPKGEVAGDLGSESYQYRLRGTGIQDMTWVMSGPKIVGINIAG
jgi:hypothetical protein